MQRLSDIKPLLALVFIFPVFASCSPSALLARCDSFREQEGDFARSIAHEVREQLGRAVPQVNLTSHTDFDWDRVHVFPPYTEDKSIEGVVGKEISCSRVGVTEVTLIVLTKDGEIVKALDWERPALDFTDLEFISYRAKDARFVIDRVALDLGPGKKPWYVFHDAAGIDRASYEVRTRLMTAARKLHRLNQAEFRAGKELEPREAKAAILDDRKTPILLKRFRKHRHNIGFCLQASYGKRGRSWHLASKDDLGPPEPGPCARD